MKSLLTVGATALTALVNKSDARYQDMASNVDF